MDVLTARVGLFHSQRHRPSQAGRSGVLPNCAPAFALFPSSPRLHLGAKWGRVHFSHVSGLTDRRRGDSRARVQAPRHERHAERVGA
jgi:hypothetical protein